MIRRGPLPGTMVGLLVCAALGCSGPRLRQARTYGPRQAERACGAIAESGVARDQALCLARLAGLRLAPEPSDVVGRATYRIRATQTLNGTAVWSIEEACDVHPDCLGVYIDRGDGAVVKTRYLSTREARGR